MDNTDISDCSMVSKCLFKCPTTYWIEAMDGELYIVLHRSIINYKYVVSTLTHRQATLWKWPNMMLGEIQYIMWLEIIVKLNIYSARDCTYLSLSILTIFVLLFRSQLSHWSSLHFLNNHPSSFLIIQHIPTKSQAHAYKITG